MDCVDHGAKVHFHSDQIQQHDSEIVTTTGPDGRVDVHLGFLQFHHVYEIKFKIQGLNAGDTELTSDPLQNLFIHVQKVTPLDDGYEFQLEFKANKEKLMTEELKFTKSKEGTKSSSGGDTELLTLVLHARVLGKGKGTPALKQGIRCIGMEADDDSEQSDWQGFD